MNRNKLVPLAVAVMMALPALLVLSPAANAQDTVPVAPTIPWEPQVNKEQRLYLTYPNVRETVVTGEDFSTNKPDCTANHLGSTGSTDAEPATLRPRPRESTIDNPRQPCAYPALSGVQGVSPQGQASFTLREGLSHSFNVTGNTSLIYVHQGRIPAAVTLTVQLRRGDDVVSTAEIRGASGENTFQVPFLLGATSRHEFKRGERIVITLTGTVSSDSSGVPNPTAPSWTVEDWGSHLQVRARDALKAATWITDESANLRTLFRPVERDAQTPSRIVAYFAVQSAFGVDDARGFPRETGIAPQFTVMRGSEPLPVGPNDATTIGAHYNTSLSQDTAGRAVWNFQPGFLDYRGFPAGEYNVTVNFPYHQGGAIADGSKARFFLTTQSITLTPYDDKDPLTSPSPLESNAHDVASGGSTTYLFLVNNTGSVNDTVRVDASFISGSPAGWSATIGGPAVTEGRVQLAPLESKIVTLTVTAPGGAPVGSSSIFQIQASSLVDPTARSVPTTVVSTVSNVVSREVRVIAPTEDIAALPGGDVRVPVYVWNRGTRFATLALEVQGNLLQDWVVDLEQGQDGTSRLVIPSVPAGGIVQAMLRVRAPLALVEGTQAVTLNVTQTDVGGIAYSQPLNFVIRPTAGVRVDILDSIAGVGHFAELTGNATSVPPAAGNPAQPIGDPRCNNPNTAREGTACFNDGVDGIWFRVWVTNTGRRTEAFDLSLDSIRVPRCDTAFQGPAQLLMRNPQGGTSDLRPLVLKPGQTGEAYVWRPVNRAASTGPCDDRNEEDSYAFVVNARGRDTGAIHRDGTKVIAMSNSGEGYITQVYLEHAGRLPGYTPETPYVDAQNATKRLVTVGIEVNTTQTYRARLTNGASWGTFTDTSANPPITRTPDARVSIAGVDREGGWNVSIRRANGDEDPNRNPWTDTIVFSNQEFNNRREAWADWEIEVRVQAPSGTNGTGLAGEQDQFTLQASIQGSNRISTLEYKAVITQFANVTVETDQPSIFAHAGQPGVALVYINNTGSSEAVVSLHAAVDPATTVNSGSWVVEPAVQTFVLPPFRNRTAAILVTPPGGAASGDVVVTAEYAPNPLQPTLTRNATIRIGTSVVPRGSLTLTSGVADVSIAPGGFANYTLNVVNTGTLPLNFRASGTEIPNWSATLSPIEGTLASGETRSVVYVLRAPADVVNGSRFSSVVKVEEIGNPQNFDLRPVSVNILGGSPVPSISVPKLQKTVDRNGVQYFEVVVRNLGSAAGPIELSTRSQDPAWATAVQDDRGNPITRVNLAPNQVTVVNVTVRAPLVVPENTLVPVEVLAEAAGQTAKATLQAAVHDYGVALSLRPSQVDAVVGLPTEFTISLRNTGNDNDTLNVSANLVDFPEWRVDLSLERVRLEPGQSTDVRAVVRMPTAPLPTPRAYTIKFFAGTVGGFAVNIPKNDSVAAVVNVLNYRPMDIDRDGFLEVAVDFDRNPANGFERFHEILPEGITSTVVAVGRMDGKARFFLDVPRDRPVDGIADVWFDPESVYAYEIRHAPDINNDNAPDYLLDTDRDGKIDRAYDTVSQTYWTVVEIKAYGDERIQYLIDINGDGRPDRFYDGEKRLVTRTFNVEGAAQSVGLDTNNDGRVDKVYDAQTSSVTDARVSGATSFFGKYWYFFVGFAILALVTILLVARRRQD